MKHLGTLEGYLGLVMEFFSFQTNIFVLEWAVGPGVLQIFSHCAVKLVMGSGVVATIYVHNARNNIIYGLFYADEFALKV